MSMERPQTMYELIDWCIRKLGGDNMFGRPVGGIIEVDITQQQAIDRANEAIYRFNQEHYNGYREVGLVLDTVEGQTEYDMPNEIINVLHYLPLNDKSSMFSFDYQMRQSMAMNFGKLGGFDLVSVELTYQWLKLMEMKIGDKKNFTFNPLTHKLNLLTPQEVDGKLALICYMLEDVELHQDVWQDQWFKSYLFALIKKQWGENLKLFGNVNLPAGATLEGQTIWQEAVDDIEKLEEELETKYSFPPMFFVG